jgi:hypothetical protein
MTLPHCFSHWRRGAIAANIGGGRDDRPLRHFLSGEDNHLRAELELQFRAIRLRTPGAPRCSCALAGHCQGAATSAFGVKRTSSQDRL